MAELALEYIVKIIILLVAAVVIISLILTFQQDILRWWTGITGDKDKPSTEPQVIKKDTFTEREIASFIAGCWSANKGSTKDAECYFLLGNNLNSFAGVTQQGIQNSLSQNIIPSDKVIFEFTTIGNALVITYDNYRTEVKSEAIVVKG